MWLAAFLAPALVLGVPDQGIFPDLDDKVELPLPAEAAATDAVVDEDHSVLVLYQGERPLKVYPYTDGALRKSDAAEVKRALGDHEPRRLKKGDQMPGGDRDGDGIPDALDVLIGAKKVALNGAAYGNADYVSIKYPDGDVPRDRGVCTDVIIRALRNAGIDLQKEVHEDIARARKAYPMVRKADANIDHRRVKTLLPWFQRHWTLVDPDEPYQPGDVIFMDTFPSKAGPDHIGILSDSVDESGLPLVINNWTDGSQESEMDLLPWVPVTHRFRVK